MTILHFALLLAITSSGLHVIMLMIANDVLALPGREFFGLLKLRWLTGWYWIILCAHA